MKKEESFKPFIPSDKVMPEMTVTSVVLGILLAVLFGGANAYLGLRVGMTVSASIPAAVISMGVIRVILKKDSILENNMVQTIGSAGESLAAGAIFTLPALFMWANENPGSAAPSFLEIALIALCGGVLGVLFMIPLRSALIVKEHGTLPYPEGKACAEVLLAGEKRGGKASTVFAGLGISGVYKLIADGFRLFPSEVDYSFKSYKGAGVGVDVLPALLGVGYICGARIASYMLAGGILSWFVLMPLISQFGGDTVIFPGADPISSLTTWEIWSHYIRYIGAGAVAAGGILSLAKSFPLIIRTFRQAVGGFGTKESTRERTARDLSMKTVVLGILATTVALWLSPSVHVTLFGALLIVVFGFFFATVSSRMVGLVGSSNNPVSGMAIATLLFSTLLLKATGTVGTAGMNAAIAIGSVICIVAAMAGDTSQDLKTGYILGATPKKQQLGELLGVLASALTIGGVLYLFNTAWSFGSAELPAPQATLMKMVVEGVMGGNLPWALVLSGAGLAVVAELAHFPVLPFAVGLYLPIHLSTPIMAGGLIRLWFDKRKVKNEAERKNTVEDGILYASGMIAGEGLVGILLAVLAVIPFKNGSLGQALSLSERGLSLGNAGGLIFFGLLILSMLGFTIWHRKNKEGV